MLIERFQVKFIDMFLTFKHLLAQGVDIHSPRLFHISTQDVEL